MAVADVERLAAAGQQYGDRAVGGFTAAREAAAEVAALGRRSAAIHADVTHKDEVAGMVEETVHQLGGLDVLVCNAGVVSVAPVEGMAEDTWDLTMAVNVKGVFLACQAAIPVMKKRGGGAIINIASVAGKNGHPGLARLLRLEVRGRRLHQRACQRARRPTVSSRQRDLPGNSADADVGILGRYTETAGRVEGSGVGALGALVHPAGGRAQTPDDIGSLAVYLASAENITGQAMNVDGGIQLH